MSSERNKAHILINIKKGQLAELENSVLGPAVMYQLGALAQRRLYVMHYTGMNRTLYFARKTDSDAPRQWIH